MKQKPIRYITDSEMALIWDRWEKGDSINAIARDPDRNVIELDAYGHSGGDDMDDYTAHP